MDNLVNGLVRERAQAAAGGDEDPAAGLGPVQGPDEFLDLRPPDYPFCRVPLGLHVDGLAVLAHITAAR
jgi:hypothetical protein